MHACKQDQIDAIAEVLSEQVGFSRTATNPDTQGWRDITEWLLADATIGAALLAKYGDRVTAYADRIDAEYDRDQEADRHMEGHWARLAEAITRQEARRLTEGSR